MKLGIVLSTRDYDGTGQGFADAMRAVEDEGLDGLWFFDAIGRGYLNPDPIGGASAAAALTRRIEIGTCIVQVPLRNPIELAQRVLTTHHLSEGRFSFGVGAGSTEADFKSLGQDFQGRFKALEDGIATMQALWRGETVNGMNLSPWPAVVGGPPILIGSWAGGRWIRIAAKKHAGWIGSAMYTNIAALKDGVTRFKADGGKRAIATNIHVDLSASGGGKLSDDDKIDLRCSPAVAKDRLKLLQDAGFDDAILVVADHSAANLAAVRALLQ